MLARAARQSAAAGAVRAQGLLTWQAPSNKQSALAHAHSQAASCYRMRPTLLAVRRLPATQPCLRALTRPAARRVCASAGASDPPGAHAPPAAAMDAPLRAAVEAIHATPTQAVIDITGGGAQAR
jgi:hypothetical protein